MSLRKKSSDDVHAFSPSEQRAARSERIKVSDAKPYGWVAHSESGTERDYYIYCDPDTKRLICTCADFVYRGKAKPGFECKHVSAVLKYIGRYYLAYEYNPHQQGNRVA
jgi:hypothetical protein